MTRGAVGAADQAIEFALLVVVFSLIHENGKRADAITKILQNSRALVNYVERGQL